MRGFILKCKECSKEFDFKELVEKNIKIGTPDYIFKINMDGAIEEIECECGNCLKII